MKVNFQNKNNRQLEKYRQRPKIGFQTADFLAELHSLCLDVFLPYNGEQRGGEKFQTADSSLRRKAFTWQKMIVSIGLWNTGVTKGSEDMPQKPIDAIK